MDYFRRLLQLLQQLMLRNHSNIPPHSLIRNATQPPPLSFFQPVDTIEYDNRYLMDPVLYPNVMSNQITLPNPFYNIVLSTALIALSDRSPVCVLKPRRKKVRKSNKTEFGTAYEFF